MDKIIHQSLFLESNGRLWSCGDNEYGQCGLRKNKNTKLIKPKPIGYFELNNIKIKKISCGIDHNLAIDCYDKVYSWGNNAWYKCGYRSRHKTSSLRNGFSDIPRCIKFFDPQLFEIPVKQIECGSDHSYVCTKVYKHYLFGSNRYNICLYVGQNDEPKLLNDNIKKKQMEKK